MDISVIIVNYNVAYFLEQTLISVTKSIKTLQVEVFVVDNNSIDQSVAMVKNKFPWVNLICNRENVGFSRANNQAIRLAKGTYILLLNPDTVLQEDTLSTCFAYMEQHAKTGAAGVYMVDGNGNYLPESKRGLPTPWVAFCKISGLSAIFPQSKWFGRYHLGFLDKNTNHEVDVLSGAFMFIRKKVLDEIGCLDEDFFMYGEDIDLSYRIQKAGYKNAYISGTRIIHYKGESTKKGSLNYVFVFYKAMSIFARKHFSRSNAGIYNIIIRLAIYARAFVSVIYRLGQKFGFAWISFIVIYAGFAYLKQFWEINYKHLPGLYPTEYLWIVVPVYIAIWLTSVYFNGGFDAPFRAYKVIRGVFLGTLVISAISNFIDNIRFSKALIILGSIWAMVVLITLRVLGHFIRYRNVNLEVSATKFVVIVGNLDEFLRVSQLIKQSEVSAELIGYISIDKNEVFSDHWLGTIDQIHDLIGLYKPHEVIFCSKNIAAHQMIQLMTQIDVPGLEYKMVPDESNFVIGSSSKNTNGQLYTIEVHLALLDPPNIRNKRVLDLLAGIAMLALGWLLIWFQKDRIQYLKNSIQLIFAKKTLVGYAGTKHDNVPKLLPGVLHVLSGQNYRLIDLDTLKRINLLYAKNYTTSQDIQIVLGAWQLLGGD